MDKRKLIITCIGAGILAGSIVLSGKLKRSDTPRGSAPDMATAVKTMAVKPGDAARRVPVTGRLIPSQTVNIFAEVGGVATYGERPFKPGTRFRKGEAMVRINSDEARAALYAAKSSFQSSLAGIVPDLKLDFPDAAPAWEAYLYDLRIDQKLPDLPAADDKKLHLFLSGRGIFTQYYNIREAETRFTKFVISAPFDGVLSTALIDAASLVRVGQPLGEFITSAPFELEAGLSYSDAASIKPGTTFEMREVNTGAIYEARVLRINEAIDEATQQVRIYAEVNDPTARAGMFLEGSIPVETFTQAVEIPVRALLDTDKVFVVRDSVAVLVPVQVHFKNSAIAIVSGLEGEQSLITDRHTEAFAGSRVQPVKTAR